MKFGVREICDVVLKAKSMQKVGNKVFYKDEPVLYFDSLKTSSLEGAATTVYAQGGRGNSRLIAWEGERTVTFTMEDALLSAESFSILSGASIVEADDQDTIKIHKTELTDIIKYIPQDQNYLNVSYNTVRHWQETTYTNVGWSTEMSPELWATKRSDLARITTGFYYPPEGGTVKNKEYIKGNPVCFQGSDNKYYWHEPEDDITVKRQYYYRNYSQAQSTNTDRIFIYISEKPYDPIKSQHDMFLENYIYITCYQDDECVTEPYLFWQPDRIEYMDFDCLLDENFPTTYNPDIYKKYRLVLRNRTTETSANLPQNYEVDFTQGFIKDGELRPDLNVLVDYYAEQATGKKLNITGDDFSGNFYLEGSTLFRSTDGQDLPARIIIPNCKIQSNFTFTMASSGDPSTFTFTIDAFPDYIRFDKKKKKVLAAIQIIDPNDSDELITRTDTSANEDFMAIAAQALRDKTWSGFEPNET